MHLLKRIFSTNRQDKVTVQALYDLVLRGALATGLYENGVAKDTFEGRFEQVALHGALILRMLGKRGQKKQAARLMDRIFSGFDHAYREKGVGDSSISRKVRGLGERFMGLARGLNEALDSENPQSLTEFLARNGLAEAAREQFVVYLRSADKALRENQDVVHAVWPDLKWATKD